MFWRREPELKILGYYHLSPIVRLASGCIIWLIRIDGNRRAALLSLLESYEFQVTQSDNGKWDCLDRKKGNVLRL